MLASESKQPLYMNGCTSCSSEMINEFIRIKWRCMFLHVFILLTLLRVLTTESCIEIVAQIDQVSKEPSNSSSVEGITFGKE